MPALEAAVVGLTAGRDRAEVVVGRCSGYPGEFGLMSRLLDLGQAAVRVRRKLVARADRFGPVVGPAAHEMKLNGAKFFPPTTF